MERPIISNVIGVGLLEMQCNFDLHMIAYKMQGSRLNIKKFPGIIIRKTKPKGTILLFKSGKFIVVGTCNQQSCQVISRKLCKDLQKIINNPKIIMKSFRISNIIAKGNLGYMVNISRIAEQPNAFKDDKSSGVYLRVSKSGKVILNGATRYGDIQQQYGILIKQLQKYKLKNEYKIKQMKENGREREKKDKNKQQQQAIQQIFYEKQEDNQTQSFKNLNQINQIKKKNYFNNQIKNKNYINNNFQQQYKF